MELEESISLTSVYTTKLQSSRQYGTGTETEIQTNGTRLPQIVTAAMKLKDTYSLEGKL